MKLKYSNFQIYRIYRRSYYLLVAITQDGYLKFEEDREDAAYGAEVKNRNFLNGSFTMLYYLVKRVFNNNNVVNKLQNENAKILNTFLYCRIISIFLSTSSV